jgi:heme-degrading monooxygenase HmoA
MYARITIGRTKRGSWEAFEAAYRQHIDRVTAKGLRARWLVRSLHDQETFFTVSLWDTLADMESYERSDAVRRHILPHITPHLSGISTAHHCEVLADTPPSVAELASLLRASYVA